MESPGQNSCVPKVGHMEGLVRVAIIQENFCFRDNDGLEPGHA